ncbi:MAG: SAM-dependent methyltransferase, partial [Chloroflexi bacterium]|nr:SAM-dependent methyltransferase [Chloroflexota bacterium]
MIQPGTVYLVGSGPGDPGLITVRGLDLLRTADVVVYDRLAPEKLLAEARPDAELIDAGKRRGDHRMTQDEINELLVKLASSGKSVCRLKG